MRVTCWLVVTCAVALAGCSESPSLPPFKPFADNRVLMQSVIEPAADVIWESVGTIITTQGTEELRPKNDQEWANVRNQAVLLAESGNLLMMEPRARDTDEWMKASQALIDTGTAAVKAAESKNPDELFSAGANLYSACTNCHQKYALGLDRVSSQ